MTKSDELRLWLLNKYSDMIFNMCSIADMGKQEAIAFLEANDQSLWPPDGKLHTWLKDFIFNFIRR